MTGNDDILPDIRKTWCGSHANRIHELVTFVAKADPLAITFTLKRHKPSSRKKCEVCGKPSMFSARATITGITKE
jgi:hypothetical protein